jgi:hypothetical protein
MLYSMIRSINSIFNAQLLNDLLPSLTDSIDAVKIKEWNPNEKLQLFLYGPDFICNMFWVFNIIGAFIILLILLLIFSRLWKWANTMKGKMLEFGYLRLLLIFSSYIITCSIVHIKHRHQEEHWEYSTEVISKFYTIISDTMAFFFLVHTYLRLCSLSFQSWWQY